MNNKIDDLVNFVDLNNKNNEVTRKKSKSFKLFIINILTIVLLLSSGMGIKTYLDQKNDTEDIININKELKNKIVTLEEEDKVEEIDEEITEPTTKTDYSQLTKINSDMVGWITVPGTEIDISVVQTSNNDYYLTHDFNKKWNSMGWAFADYRNSFPSLDGNTIIYGHTYKRTIIFSTLKDVLKKEWLNNKDMQYITFNTLEEDLVWEVFSVYTIKKTNDYLVTSIDDDFINMIKERSIKDFNVDVSVDDKIITLSTCYNNSNTRLVVHAKKVMDN